MKTIKVWTKQNINVLQQLNETGRYVAKKEYVIMDLAEHAYLVLEVYDWLVKNTPNAAQKPGDAEYPVWLSLSKSATMLPSKAAVILELELPVDLVTLININKWGTMLNYSYIPANGEDAIQHRMLLEQYGISDTKAYMSRFYPQIKRKIIASWDRLFDHSITLGNTECYGNIWEIRKEWITQIMQ